MSVLRALGVLLAGVLAVATTLGFAVQRTLDDPTAFTTSMTDALADPPVSAEIKREISDEVTRALKRYAASGNTLAQLGLALGADAIAQQAADLTDTDAFRSAWRSWSRLIFDGLAAEARGRSDGTVTVSGRRLSVGVEPLLAPVLGPGIAGGATQLLDFVDAETVVTVDTGVPIGPVLRGAGALAQWRWGLLIAALTVAALVLLGRRRAGWGAALLVWSGLLCAGSALLVTLVQQRPVPGSEFPQLGLAIVTALTGSWPSILLTVATGCFVGAGVLLLVGTITKVRGTRAGRATP